MTATKNGFTSGTTPTAPYVVKDMPGMAARPMRVVCIGAGLSGIYLGIKLPAATENVDLCIYEKNTDVGGTWFENVYPGVQCDVPAHRYVFTFEPNPSWSNFYAPGPEIQKYFAGVAKKYDVLKYIKLQHKVTGAKWNESEGVWDLQVMDSEGITFTDRCDVLINGMGVLNAWKWPSIEGLHSFKGTLLHSANYDTKVSLKGKSVAVIGSGSSGIQIIPAIQPEVKKVGAYLRSSTWIVPPFGSQYIKKDSNNELIYEYSEEERLAFANDPEAFLEYRRILEKDVSSRFRLYVKDHPSQAALRPILIDYMKSRLAKKPELAEHLIPKWPVGCRRLTPGIGFLEALCEDNVEPIFSDIAQVTPEGIITRSGEKREYDVIICATGFDVSYGARFPFEGRGGAKLDEEFHKAPYSYFGIGTPGFPNYWSFHGPNSPVGAGSLVPATEAVGDYIVRAIIKMQRQSIKSMVPRSDCVREFVQHTDTFMPRMVWTEGCRSWYKNGTIGGRVSALWPGSGLHFVGALEDPRWEDYEYTYPDPVNRYSYLGDGFTQLEWDGGDRTHDLGERTRRFEKHPALVDSSIVMPKSKAFLGEDAVANVLGNRSV